ncbi:MarR family winged helix-turn-helix transcriptional regulator [Acerihabitans arboris]|uniref:MarR family transcriptional regulator n=1 Tax=Acerihabitans arboris TaxID=2691583 RepID=A0A845SEP2_9GAMM|nr:MarR family transcriptional regulator [Acerihabitans arboris]NDL61188.1 MarR family transcriptional regulator [Acerihabitans arboris]
MVHRPRLAEQLCYSIYSTAIAIKRLYKPMLDAMGVTYPQYLVLNVLWERGKQSIGGIGETLALETSTLTPLLKRLEAEGFIERVRNPEDERQVMISITDKGKGLEDKSSCLSETLFCSAGLELAQLQRLNQEIIRLRDNIVSRHPEKN